MRRTVAVIGAGASGMMAALHAAKEGAKVTVFEKNGEPMKKLLRTGNGKCNITNAFLDLGEYISSDVNFVKDRIVSFSNNDLIHYLRELGLITKEKNGYVYPYSEQASTVSSLFLSEAGVYGVDIRLNSFVNMIAKEEDKFLISVEGVKERFPFDRVIVSTGSKAGLIKGEKENGSNLLKPFDVKFNPVYPGLTKLVLKDFDFPDVKGVRNDAKVTLYKNGLAVKEEYGEVLFWEKGISGICVFNLSNLCKRDISENDTLTVSVDLFPEFEDSDLDALKEFACVSALLNNQKSLSELFEGFLKDKLAHFLFDLCGFDGNVKVGEVSKEDITGLIDRLKEITFEVSDVAGYESAQVCVGGLDTSELTSDLELRSVPGMYVTGELLDVCGPCGGYNLQWAFTSGAIAGEKACC